MFLMVLVISGSRFIKCSSSCKIISESRSQREKDLKLSLALSTLLVGSASGKGVDCLACV